MHLNWVSGDEATTATAAEHQQILWFAFKLTWRNNSMSDKKKRKKNTEPNQSFKCMWHGYYIFKHVFLVLKSLVRLKYRRVFCLVCLFFFSTLSFYWTKKNPVWNHSAASNFHCAIQSMNAVSGFKKKKKNEINMRANW